AGCLYRLWQCPRCRTIHAVDHVDFQDIYAGYPLNSRPLDLFARGTLGNVLSRLRRHGIKKSDSILDYGCGNGLLVRFLKARGYAHVDGYDPYVQEFAAQPVAGAYEWVVANDVIEHCPDPSVLLRDCLRLLRPGGLLYVGMPTPEGVDMADLEPH